MRRFNSRPPFRPIIGLVVVSAASAFLSDSAASFAQQTPAPSPTPMSATPSPPKQSTLPKANATPAFPPSDLKLPPKNVAPKATPGNVAVPEISGPLTLNQAIGLALQLQPNIAASTASREGGEQRVKQATARYYPSVAPTYTFTQGYNVTQTSQFVSNGSTGAATNIGNANTGTTGGTTTGTTTGTTGTTGTGTTPAVSTSRQTGTGTTTGDGTTTGGTTGTTTGNTNTGGQVVTSLQGRTVETRNANIGLTYRLYDSGSRELTARQARQNVRELEFAEENTRQTTIVNVADTYFSALRNAALVRVAEAQVARAQNTRDVVRAQVAVGVTAAKDQLQADADFFNAQVNLLTARNNAANALASLKQAIGIVGGEPVVLADVPAPGENTPTTVILDEAASQPAGTPAAAQPPASPDAPPVSSQPSATVPDETATINRLADLAYRTRPDIAQALQGIEGNQTSVSLSRINTRVIVNSDVSAGYGINGRNFDGSTGNNRQINVNLSYPLFDAGLSRSQVRSAEAIVRSSQAQLTSLRQQIAVQVEQTYRTLTVSRATLPAALSAQQAAQVNYDAALASKQEGVGSIVDVITAQTSLVQAQTNYVQAVYNFYTADADLARAVGQASRIGQSGASPAAATAPATPGTPGTPPAAPAAVPTPPAPVSPPAGGARPTSVPGGPTNPATPATPAP